jgi:broad specificity phosphatase PhoE
MNAQQDGNTSHKRLYELNASQTIETIQTLLDRGIQSMAVMMRHSDRFYHKDPMMEPFMGLNAAGKTYAYDMGQALPDLEPRLFASHFGRCIETAYLIDKGYTRSRGASLPHTQTCDLLTPFYIKDIKKALTIMMDTGSRPFIRAWFNHEIAVDIMENPETTADMLTDFMKEQLSEVSDNQIAVCVSHDWNIYPIREFKLGLTHEAAGDVGYLDGIVFFQEKGQTFAVSRQAGPIAV